MFLSACKLTVTTYVIVAIVLLKLSYSPQISELLQSISIPLKVKLPETYLNYVLGQETPKLLKTHS